MRGSLCVVGLILFTTLTEGSVFRHHAREQLKKNSLIPAPKKTDLETPLGKYIIELVRYNTYA